MGGWCPKCGRKKCDEARRAYTIEDLRKIASSRNGKCLSHKYTRADAHYIWTCEYGHQWSAIFNDIKGNKKHKATWCPYCSKKKKHTIEEMQQFAKSKGGECLSEEYVNAKVTLLWRCSCGREFRESWTNIQGGRWCRKNCKDGKYGIGRI